MKQNITLLLLLFSIVTFSQKNIKGKATYKTHRKSSIKMDSTLIAQNPALQEQLEAQMRKMFQKTYTLNFTKSESIYKEEQALESPKVPQSNGGVFVMSVGGGGSDLLYKNSKENRIANKVDLMGKIFLIKDSLIKYDWKLTEKTKNIGKYTCYRAVYEFEEENSSFRFVNNETKEKKEKVKRKITAWYTPDIPINNGPQNYGGLPGLILEINDGDITIVCTEIILNPSETIDIKEPKKGKQVSRKRFEEISREKTEEMMNRYRSRDGKGIEIRIGG